MTWLCVPRGRETGSGVTRGREARRLRMVCVAVLLVPGWLMVLPAAAANILRGEDPAVLLPPSGQKGLYFGFSLAHYADGSNTWLLVGAPRFKASIGGLYKCLLSKSDVDRKCEEVHVDFTNDGSYPLWAKSNNTDQGLGFSLASDGKAIVVCAPQWFASKKKFNEMSYLPAGMCFAAESLAHEFKAFSPPFDDQSAQSMSYLNTGSCQFGLSATYVKGQNTFAFGAPGCWTWRGDTWEVQLDSTSSNMVKSSASRLLGKFQQDERWESNGRYVGYSVASLKFGDKNAIVSSIPRSAEINLFGPTILILIQHPDDEKTLIVHHKISPSKVASDNVGFAFFGYSLATLDVNGDGLEDLVVGAPFYRYNSTGYDQGAVFIYMQTATENHATGEKVYQMREEDNAPQRKGSVSFSRFGSCAAAVGDLDGDGYEDLAVGAPYMAVSSDGHAGTGAVYIYMGSQTGLEKNPIQIIRAAANQFGFGSSIAQQLPSIEGQGYDVAVGVYNSDTVLIFKSKEVLGVGWNLTFSGPIDLTINKCICTNVVSLCPCVDGKFCLKFQKNIVKNENNVKIGFNITLNTIDDELSLVHEKTDVNAKTELQIPIEVEEGENICETFKILAKPNIQEIKSFIIMGDASLSQGEKNVILDRHSVLRKREHLHSVIHCASSDISGCQSDIILQYDILDNYILMSEQAMKIHFNVTNRGETAYESILIVRSADVFIIRDVEGGEVTCENYEKEIECKIGRLNTNFEVSFNLSLMPGEKFFPFLDTHTAVFDIVAEVETLSALSDPDTAVKEIQADIIVEGSLQLHKQASQPSIVYFDDSSEYKSPKEAKSEEELGPEIDHRYIILNNNKFSIYEAELTVLWPHTIDGKHFLYLLEEMSFNGTSHISYDCQYPSGVVDPFSLSANTQTPGSHRDTEGVSALSMEIGDKSPEHKIITCSLGEISGGGQIALSLRSRLVLRTLVELEVGGAVKNASSVIELQVTRMPLSYVPPEPSRSSVSTTISYQKGSPDATLPVWLYVVSVLVGLLVLGIIVIIMWKCGFFKRQRVKAPDDVDVNQEEHLTKDEEEEAYVQDDDVRTPTTPMLKETENAIQDFEFRRA